jgi:tetratricopeptide (TPR) repeat protein
MTGLPFHSNASSSSSYSSSSSSSSSSHPPPTPPSSPSSSSDLNARRLAFLLCSCKVATTGGLVKTAKTQIRLAIDMLSKAGGIVDTAAAAAAAAANKTLSAGENRNLSPFPVTSPGNVNLNMKTRSLVDQAPGGSVSALNPEPLSEGDPDSWPDSNVDGADTSAARQARRWQESAIRRYSRHVLTLKANVEYSRQNYRKAIKLLSDSRQALEPEAEAETEEKEQAADGGVEKEKDFQQEAKEGSEGGKAVICDLDAPARSSIDRQSSYIYYNNVACVYFKMRKFDIALLFFQRALTQFAALGEIVGAGGSDTIAGNKSNMHGKGSQGKNGKNRNNKNFGSNSGNRGGSSSGSSAPSLQQANLTGVSTDAHRKYESQIIYNSGLCLLFSGRAADAYSCLEPLILKTGGSEACLWIRLAECCLLSELQRREKELEPFYKVDADGTGATRRLIVRSPPPAVPPLKKETGWGWGNPPAPEPGSHLTVSQAIRCLNIALGRLRCREFEMGAMAQKSRSPDNKAAPASGSNRPKKAGKKKEKQPGSSASVPASTATNDDAAVPRSVSIFDTGGSDSDSDDDAWARAEFHASLTTAGMGRLSPLPDHPYSHGRGSDRALGRRGESSGSSRDRRDTTRFHDPFFDSGRFSDSTSDGDISDDNNPEDFSLSALGDEGGGSGAHTPTRFGVGVGAGVDENGSPTGPQARRGDRFPYSPKHPYSPGSELEETGFGGGLEQVGLIFIFTRHAPHTGLNATLPNLPIYTHMHACMHIHYIHLYTRARFLSPLLLLFPLSSFYHSFLLTTINCTR